MLACFERATESTWGLPSVARSGEAGYRRPYVHLFGFAQTSHHAPNSFVNSTSHSSRGIYLQKPRASMVVGVLLGRTRIGVLGASRTAGTIRSRPIAYRIEHFRGVFWGGKPAKPTASTSFMERVMGIELTSETGNSIGHHGFPSLHVGKQKDDCSCC